jgi:uncharacterized protein YndB with AHSA1/START domain
MGVQQEQFHVEYIFNRVSKNSLWNCLSTSGGLAEWFADDVSDDGKLFTFWWDKHAVEAELIGISPYLYIRFHWVEEAPDTYFEFRLHKVELTGDYMLEIIDFSEKEETEQAITLWDAQIKALKRRLGL